MYFNHADRNFSTWWKSKDFSRINYGAGLTQYNFRGRREKVFTGFIAGYTTQFAFGYQNIYVDKLRRHSINLEAYFENQNKLDYSIRQNEPVELETESRIYKKNNFIVNYAYRKKIHKTFGAIFLFFDFSISDTIALLNSDYLGQSKKEVTFSGINFYYENDQRDLKYYPLAGYYVLLKFNYYGLFNSEYNKPEVEASYHKFFRLSPDFFFSAGIKTQLTPKIDQPYILKEALGYDYFLRGYENYVINGHNYLLFKSNLKYRLLPEKSLTLNSFHLNNSIKFTFQLMQMYFSMQDMSRIFFPMPKMWEIISLIPDFILSVQALILLRITTKCLGLTLPVTG
ncbi:MAG: hypothetical protein HC906_02725 [Bacteroidales bacterium]|nr:hypothetical protein [Bacteroidales bacterium]